MQKLTVQDPETKSPDLAAENLAKLRALFPELVTEGKDGVAVNLDVLKALVGDNTVTDGEEKYGLNWHGKRRARQLALMPSTGTLRPCPEDSVDWDTTKNLMIEGDNLEVLKLLQKSYAGKVKLIYIDPPYNTGKDFVYPDNFQDNIKNYLELTGQTDEGGRKLSSNTEASGRFHTDWLNMVYPRLKLARNLLRGDGVIFVSIDDGEVPNLRLVLDDIFGPENFICQICVVSNPRGRQSETIATTHEYLLCYGRDSECSVVRGQPLSDAQLKEFKFQTSDGRRYRLRGLRHRGNASRRVDRPKMYFPLFVNPVSREVSLERTDAHCMEVVPRKSTGEDGRWEWGPDTAGKRVSLLEGVLISGRDEWDVFQREFLDSEEGETRTTKWKTVWDEAEINYQNGKTELKGLFGEPPFDFPKPTYLLKKIIGGTLVEDEIILDFFAGSATTGHSVFEANNMDGGQRRFILVQLPEPTENKKYQTIADITKERLRRAGKKIREENSLFAGDLGFRVFKLASSNIREWDPNRENLAESLEASIEHLKTDRSEQDILFELLLKLGLDLCVPIETNKIGGHQVHSIGGGSLLVCLSTKIPQKEVESLALGIVAWHQSLKPAGETTVVFRDSAFADDVAKSNLTAILHQHGLETVRSL